MGFKETKVQNNPYPCEPFEGFWSTQKDVKRVQTELSVVVFDEHHRLNVLGAEACSLWSYESVVARE